MKAFTFLLTAIALISFSSCKKEREPLNENYIAVNTCKDFVRQGKTLTCCLDSVLQDSRCAADAVCIWEGSGVARFRVSTAGKNHNITLSTSYLGGVKKDTIVEGFKIEFINLLPARLSAKPFNYNDYLAEVKVTAE